tara:strand:- start:456 stop:1250 length:795 start_codon:yes stop_codon:yes gene_type:complete
MRYFIHLGFDGSSYSGWQRQKNTRNTVQEIIEQTLSDIFKKGINIHGCGRTDAGVHASQYVIQINLDEAPTFDLKFRMNKNLPDGISVFEIIEVNEKQHCQYDAVARTYDYFIHWNKNSVLFRYSSLYEGLTLNFERMQEVAALILQNKDFRALCKQPDSYHNTLCQISECQLFVDETQGRMRFTITSNRFLRGMIRICVFLMLEVGSGKMTLDEFKDILNQKKELKKKWLAYPNGLFLSRVKYPFLELDESDNLVSMLSIGLK